MMKRSTLISSLAISLILTSASVFAADQVYGSQLMTEQERVEHRNRMKNAKSEGERNEIRNEHHKRMQLRAKEKGVSLPETPPARGKGKGKGAKDGSGPGAGMRDGSGPGKGMGGGKGSGMGR